MASFTFKTRLEIDKTSRLNWRDVPVVVQDETPDEVIQLSAYILGAVTSFKFNIQVGDSLRIPRLLVPQFMSFVAAKSDDSKAYIALQLDLYNDVEISLVAVDETGASGGAGGSARIAGTVQIDDEPKARDVIVISDDKGSRAVLAESTSQADGTFDITYSGWTGPVIAMALEHYGGAWTASTLLNGGTTVHPTTPNGYVYAVTTAGTTGATEPAWTTDTQVQSGSVTLAPRRYFRPVASGPMTPE